MNKLATLALVGLLALTTTAPFAAAEALNRHVLDGTLGGSDCPDPTLSWAVCYAEEGADKGRDEALWLIVFVVAAANDACDHYGCPFGAVHVAIRGDLLP